MKAKNLKISSECTANIVGVELGDIVKDPEMSLDQLNEYLIKRASAICKLIKGKSAGTYTSDIIPPICSIDMSLHQNIDNVLACFSNTLAAALFSESEYIRIFKNFENLSGIVDEERFLLFEFLSENNLSGKFNEFLQEHKCK